MGRKKAAGCEVIVTARKATPKKLLLTDIRELSASQNER